MKLSRVDEVDKKNRKYDRWFHSALGAPLVLLAYTGLSYGVIHFAGSREPYSEGEAILM